MAQEIEEVGEEELGDAFNAVEAPVRQIGDLAKRLSGYARLPRVLLAEPKRRMRTFTAERAIADTVAVFDPLLRRHRVSVREEYDARGSRLRGPSALLDAILSNLIINAIHALDRTVEQPREILVRTTREGNWFILEIGDNGPGIQELALDEIWVPGTTTNTDGTGLGLTIVRDSAGQLGGTVDAMPEGELGGAHFTVRLPVAK